MVCAYSQGEIVRYINQSISQSQSFSLSLLLAVNKDSKPIKKAEFPPTTETKIIHPQSTNFHKDKTATPPPPPLLATYQHTHT